MRKADGRCRVAPKQNPELAQQLWRDHPAMVEDRLIFAEANTETGFRQYESPHALIP